MRRKRRIYVASSWRNVYQPDVVALLRIAGHEVYDFRHPQVEYNNPVEVVEPKGFNWRDIDPHLRKYWTVGQLLKGLEHPIARAAFQSDRQAMLWADTCVMVMPCGRSAHIEAGYFTGALTHGTLGQRKELYIYLPPRELVEPELMHLMANDIFCDIDALIARLAES